MEQKNLRDKLRARRESLGYSQEYMAAKLGISQAGYSLIELGPTRITARLQKELKSIEKFEDYDEPAAGEMTGGDTPATLAERWRLGIPLLYVTVVLIGALVLDRVFYIGEELYRGFSGEKEENEGVMGIIAVIYFVIGVWSIYWLVFRSKWPRNERP